MVSTALILQGTGRASFCKMLVCMDCWVGFHEPVGFLGLTEQLVAPLAMPGRGTEVIVLKSQAQDCKARQKLEAGTTGPGGGGCTGQHRRHSESLKTPRNSLSSLLYFLEMTVPILGRLSIFYPVSLKWAFLVVQMAKNLPAMQETCVRSMGQKDPLKKRMATHSSVLAWRVPGTEETGSCRPWGHKELDTTESLKQPFEYHMSQYFAISTNHHYCHLFYTFFKLTHCFFLL